MRQYWVPVLIGVLGGGILLALGNWQVQRLAWKEGKLAEIEAQIHDAPMPLESALALGIQEFQPILTQGRFLEGEAHVLRSIKGQGVVFRVISPFETTQGRRILIDRGYVPEMQKASARSVGPAQVIANYRTPEETDSWTPAPDWDANYVYARDVPMLAAHFDTEEILLIARQSTGETSIIPWPVDTAAIPNDHLQYAVTWFSLAAVWFGMTGLWIGRIRRADG